MLRLAKILHDTQIKKNSPIRHAKKPKVSCNSGLEPGTQNNDASPTINQMSTQRSQNKNWNIRGLNDEDK
jgi:hypothetical protein